MTSDDIIKMAREAGATTVDQDDPQCYIGDTAFDEDGLKRFYAMAVAAEREACAITAWSAGMDAHNAARGLPCDARDVGSKAAKAIRARDDA